MRSRSVFAVCGLLTSLHVPWLAAECWAQQPAVGFGSGSILVHIGSGHPVRLERQGATEDDWIVACRSPCDAQVSIEGTYRIAGEGVRTSAPFTLPSSDGRRLSIDVDTGSKAVLVLGIVLTSVSSAVALVGVVIHMLAKGADIDRSLAPTGIAVAAGGVAGVATGIVLIVMNARTTQTIEPARAARQPTWRAADWAPGISPQLMLPVLTF